MWLAIEMSVATIVGCAAVPPEATSPSPSPEQLVVQMADTPAEHRAVAQYFRDKAESTRVRAEYHRSMGSSYPTGKVGARMRDHCDRISALERGLVKELEALARLHEAEADRSEAARP
jgi:hypothetical protein